MRYFSLMSYLFLNNSNDLFATLKYCVYFLSKLSVFRRKPRMEIEEDLSVAINLTQNI